MYPVQKTPTKNFPTTPSPTLHRHPQDTYLQFIITPYIFSLPTTISSHLPQNPTSFSTPSTAQISSPTPPHPISPTRSTSSRHYPHPHKSLISAFFFSLFPDFSSCASYTSSSSSSFLLLLLHYLHHLVEAERTPKPPFSRP